MHKRKKPKEKGLLTTIDIDIHEEIIPLVVLQKVTNIKWNTMQRAYER